MTQLHKVAHVMRRFTMEKWGGTETVVFNIARALIKGGIESPIFCTDMLVKPGREMVEEVPVNRFRYVFPWFGLGEEAKRKLVLKGGSPLSLPLFFGLLKEKNVSIVHTHVQHRLGGIARTVAKLKRIPYVVNIHGGYFTAPAEQFEKMKDPFRGKFEWGRAFGLLWGARRTLEDAHGIICVGQVEYEEMKKRLPHKACHYVPNGVHVDLFKEAKPEPFREAYRFTPQDKIILCVSRIDYQKNQLLLVKSFARFASDHPDHKLVLVGPVTVEAYHEAILAEIKAHGLEDRVTIIKGFKPGDPLLQSAFKAAEMFVLPTAHEPFGIVILEAWAAGLPVIATRIGGIPGFTHDGRDILWFEDGDEEMLATRMATLAESPEKRKSLSEAAFEEVSTKYDWSMIAAQMRGIYEQTIEEFNR